MSAYISLCSEIGRWALIGGAWALKGTNKVGLHCLSI